MFRSKYNSVLTIVLIIVIIAILIVITTMGIKAYKNYEDDKERKKIISEMQENGLEDDENQIGNNTNENVAVIDPITNENINSNQNTNGGSNGTSRPKVKKYKGYTVIGYIKIEKTNLEYPILLDVSPGALETAVGVMYPDNPQLNEPGITVIIGHNYRNGKFFSNNKELIVGDKIKITDLTGRTLTYEIYEISTVPDTDTEYISRDRGNNTEIALSTCTDDGQDRLVILAKVK